MGGMVGYPSLTFQVRFTKPTTHLLVCDSTVKFLFRALLALIAKVPVCFVPLSVQLICSYLFMPVAFMMGIPYEESFTVAELIGTKIFINEFIAYQKLAVLKNNRLGGLEEIIGGERQWISVRRPSPNTCVSDALTWLEPSFSDARSDQKPSPPTLSVDSLTSAHWALWSEACVSIHHSFSGKKI